MKTKTSTATRALALALALSIAGVSGSAFAAPPSGHDDHRQDQPRHEQSHDNRGGQKPEARHNDDRRDRPEFRAQDSREVRNYFHEHKVTRHALPKGVHLRVGHKRPDHVRYEAVPAPLLKRLPDRPGYRYYMAGDDVILVAITTGIIADILTSVHTR